MRKIILLLLAFFVLACNAFTEDKKKEKKESKKNSAEAASNDNSAFTVVAQMPKKLKEISGIAKDGNFIWAISDNPKSDIFKLDLSGNVVQQLSMKNITVTDVEDVTADADYLYVADVGDNDGSRGKRQIIKIKKADIGTGEKVDVDGEIIRFSFPAQGDMQKKNKNENDCEALINFKDALYLFTKRRNDLQTELFMLSKRAGNQVPKSSAMFNSKGLITGASINSEGNEVALVAYQHGHKQPFIWTLTGFSGDNFFS
ncbi:MAG: hypothetical protein WKF91_11275, partial [Segetibacter sp.]